MKYFAAPSSIAISTGKFSSKSCGAGSVRDQASFSTKTTYDGGESTKKGALLESKTVSLAVTVSDMTWDRLKELLSTCTVAVT